MSEKSKILKDSASGWIKNYLDSINDPSFYERLGEPILIEVLVPYEVLTSVSKYLGEEFVKPFAEMAATSLMINRFSSLKNEYISECFSNSLKHIERISKMKIKKKQKHMIVSYPDYIESKFLADPKNNPNDFENHLMGVIDDLFAKEARSLVKESSGFLKEINKHNPEKKGA